jgi:uncharacterized membrane protein YdjX (TVP38/TMEM64 family)
MEIPQIEKEPNRNIRKLKFWILIGFIALCVIGSIYWHTQDYSVRDSFKHIKESRYAPTYFILLSIALSFIPILPVLFTGGFIFKFIPAVIYALIASLIFSTLVFYMARILGRDYFESCEPKNKKFRKIDLKIREDPFENLLLLRFFFIIPPEVINVYAGLTRIKFRYFILSTLIANIPLTICSIGLIRGRVVNDPFSFYSSILGFAVMLAVSIIFSEKIRNKIKKYFKK